MDIKDGEHVNYSQNVLAEIESVREQLSQKDITMIGFCDVVRSHIMTGRLERAIHAIGDLIAIYEIRFGYDSFEDPNSDKGLMSALHTAQKALIRLSEQEKDELSETIKKAREQAIEEGSTMIYIVDLVEKYVENRHFEEASWTIRDMSNFCVLSLRKSNDTGEGGFYQAFIETLSEVEDALIRFKVGHEG